MTIEQATGTSSLKVKTELGITTLRPSDVDVACFILPMQMMKDVDVVCSILPMQMMKIQSTISLLYNYTHNTKYIMLFF
jgi:hypothetical protein